MSNSLINRSFSLLTCEKEEMLDFLNTALAQEKTELAALKWTRSDIRRIKKLFAERFPNN